LRKYFQTTAIGASITELTYDFSTAPPNPA
jgi:hypothetical protein